jgi:protein-L-isoaspartate(D-aspartate) O-methyltransferase
LAPFDKIIVTAFAEKNPQILFKQLGRNGKMIFPKLQPDGIQWLVLIHNNENEPKEENLIPVRFVPLV